VFREKNARGVGKKSKTKKQKAQKHRSCFWTLKFFAGKGTRPALRGTSA